MKHVRAREPRKAEGIITKLTKATLGGYAEGMAQVESDLESMLEAQGTHCSASTCSNSLQPVFKTGTSKREIPRPGSPSKSDKCNRFPL